MIFIRHNQFAVSRRSLFFEEYAAQRHHADHIQQGDIRIGLRGNKERLVQRKGHKLQHLVTAGPGGIKALKFCNRHIQNRSKAVGKAH
jgi:hypothetical protein